MGRLAQLIRDLFSVRCSQTEAFLECGNGADRLLENRYFAQARTNSAALAHELAHKQWILKSSVATTLSEEGILLFALPYRESKEDGGSQRRNVKPVD